MASPAMRPNPASFVTKNARGEVNVARGFTSSFGASTPSPAAGMAWMTSRVKELKDTARAQMDAAAAAPERLKSAARESVRQRLIAVLGPRAAESVMSGSVSLNPATHARNAVMRARAFAFRHRVPIAAVVGTGATYVTYRGAIGVAQRVRGDAAPRLDGYSRITTFALSAGVVTGAAVYLRARSTVNPEHVHAAVMRRLERHAGLREVLGAPIVPSEHRAIVTTGGVWTSGNRSMINSMVPTMGPPRFRDAKVHMAFTVEGTRKRGLVTVEAKKRGVLAVDPYDYKLVAVDVSADDGGEHRVYLAGGSDRYVKQGEVTGMQLRESLVSVMSASYEREQRSEEDDEDAERRLVRNRKKAERAPKPLDKGGGMWPRERVTDYVAQKRHEAAKFVTNLGVQDTAKQ